ncbi:g11856 [Coccomyxa viridis]|uniref:G11856 protein n=1 Tax=Coccomyxa viridis TaxID=1274662 RepID=A0ABP1G8W9_9CHLO
MRCPARVQAALFLAAEFLYSWLHLRPLMPLILPENVADEAFLRDFTTGTYFASELFLFCLLAFASPIRLIVPRIVLGVHAAFHVLYMLLASFHREWALQQNVSRVQISRSGGHSLAAIIWAWLLNGLNLADAGLHVLYMALFAMQLL